jgi:signal peptidase I
LDRALLAAGSRRPPNDPPEAGHVNLERDPDDAAEIESAAEAQRIVRDALEQAVRIQSDTSPSSPDERRPAEDGEDGVAERLAEADREAAERVRQAVAVAADLMAHVREEAEKLAGEIVQQAQLDAQAASQERLANADRLAAEVLRTADRLALDIVEEARRSSSPIEGADGIGPPPTPDPPDDGQSHEVGEVDGEAGTVTSSRRPRRRPNLLGKTARVVLLVLVGVVGSDLVRSCVAEPYTVASTSMEPELKDGNRLVVDKLAYRFGEVRRGDVVVFDTSRISDETVRLGETLVKRVIGLPGESVRAVDGVVLVDGVPVPEPSPGTPKTPSFGPVQVPDGSVFVLGDNRVVSIDSRTFGPVPADAIIGRVDAVLWPPGDAGPL